MCFALRHVICPECSKKYKVEAKNNLGFGIMVGVAILSIAFLNQQLMPAGYGWVSFIVIIIGVFCIAPFNQKLEECS